MKISRGLSLAFVTVALVAVIGFALAAQYFQVKIPTIGNIVTVNVAVFSDPACTTQIVMIDWGTLAPGESKTIICYIKSLQTLTLPSPCRLQTIIRTKHKAKNTSKQTRRPERNHTRMGTQPRTNPNPRCTKRTTQNRNRPLKPGKPPTQPADISVKAANAQRNPRKQPKKQYKLKLGTK